MVVLYSVVSQVDGSMCVFAPSHRILGQTCHFSSSSLMERRHFTSGPLKTLCMAPVI